MLHVRNNVFDVINHGLTNSFKMFGKLHRIQKLPYWKKKKKKGFNYQGRKEQYKRGQKIKIKIKKSLEHIF